MSEIPTGLLSSWEKQEVDEAMAVFVRSLEAIGMVAIVIVDGRGSPACMYSANHETKIPTLLASTYGSVTKRIADKAN